MHRAFGGSPRRPEDRPAVSGEVIATGGRLRVSARAWDVPTSRELVRAASEVPFTGDVRAAFDSVSLRLLRYAGIDSVSADDARSSTRNIDAYKAYLRGLYAVGSFQRGRTPEGIDDLIGDASEWTSTPYAPHGTTPKAGTDLAATGFRCAKTARASAPKRTRPMPRRAGTASGTPRPT
jgi:hypothetical protein